VVTRLRIRRYSWTVPRLAPSLRPRQVPAGIQLPVPRRLRRPWQILARNYLSAYGVQSEVSTQLFPAPRKSRMLIDQPHLRLLWRMYSYQLHRQTKIQHKIVETVHRLLQLPSRCCPHWRPNPLHARRTFTWPRVDRTDQKDRKANGRARHWTPLWSALVWSWQRYARVGWEWERRIVYLWSRLCANVLQEARPWLSLPSASGCRRGLRILRQAAAHYHILCAKLLWWVQQLRSTDERRREPCLLLSNTKTSRTKNRPNE